MFFESHAHYDDRKFDIDRDELLTTLQKKGIDHVVNVGADMNSSKKSIELSKKYPYIYSAVGVHPHYVDKLQDSDLNHLETFAGEEKVVAIGEIGLDFHYDRSPREVQRIWFKKQLELAKKLELPVIIHSREASKEIFDTLKEANLSNRNGKGAGVIHCFSESVEMAKEYVKLGYYIGVGGVITFKNAKTLVNVVEAIPLQSILLETDCPYLSPVPNRGERNDSTNLKYVAEAIASIKGISLEEVARSTSESAIRLFE